MKQIDFLPARYRQETVHRKANVWRILVAARFAAVLLTSAVYQQLLRRGTEQDLARVSRVYDQTQAVASQLAAVQGRVREADAEAELLTYLRHPWPSSQLLAAALAPLPDCITLDEIHLAHDQPSGPEPGVPVVALPQRGPGSGEAAEKKTGTPAQRALAQLRKEYDGRPVVLTLAGLTSDTASLQRVSGDARRGAPVWQGGADIARSPRRRAFRQAALYRPTGDSPRFWSARRSHCVSRRQNRRVRADRTEEKRAARDAIQSLCRLNPNHKPLRSAAAVGW